MDYPAGLLRRSIFKMPFQILKHRNQMLNEFGLAILAVTRRLQANHGIGPSFELGLIRMWETKLFADDGTGQSCGELTNKFDGAVSLKLVNKLIYQRFYVGCQLIHFLLSKQIHREIAVVIMLRWVRGN